VPTATGLSGLPFHLQIPLSGALLALLTWLLLDQLGRRCRRDGLPRALLLSGRLSIAGAVLIAGLGWWLAALLDPALVDLQRDGAEVRDTLISLGVVWTLLRWRAELRGGAERYGPRLLPRLSRQDQLFVFDVLEKLLGGAAFLVALFEALALLGVSAGVLITAGGFGAAALAFGARTIVENGLSGLSLYINRPFILGDQISLPVLKLQGTVEHVGWFYTELRDPDRQRIYIPNGVFTSQAVLNAAQIDSRRIWIEFAVRQADLGCIPAIVAALEAELAALPGIDPQRERAVHAIDYGDASLRLRLLCFAAGTELRQTWELRQQLLLRIGEAVERAGASLAEPGRGLTPAPGAPDRP
jgi:MscS family membrane protein